MEKSIKLFVLAAICSLFIVSGCAHYPGGIAPSTTPTDGKEYDILGSVKGTDSRICLLGIIPISGPNDTHQAVENALRSSGGDALINVTVEFVPSYWILWTNQQTVVRGNAIKFRQPKPAAVEAPAPEEMNEPEES